MTQSIETTSISGKRGAHNVDVYPHTCPICHTSLYPRFVSAVSLQEGEYRVQAAFQCTKPDCGHLFIGNYKSSKQLNLLALASVAPIVAKSHSFSEEIRTVSPIFVDIYNQALVAEALNLDQLTGIGLRKALEFFVKDFAISQNTDKEREITSRPLGQCINDYLDDPRIKTCAKLASWLGNDETHYIRKWEDKDISDLKLLIKLTVNWVENHLLTEKYTTDML